MNTIDKPASRLESPAEEVPLQVASQDIREQKYQLKDRLGKLVDRDIDGCYQRIVSNAGIGYEFRPCGRRGAQMATFDIGHPDVLDFIEAKREDGCLRQFNLSLLITDEFMKAVIDGRDWSLAFPLTQVELEAEGFDPADSKQVIWRD